MADKKELRNERKIDDWEFLSDDDDHKEARKRYAEWRSKDPFPGIKPTLLHSGQIRDYILKTGMLSPFTREDLDEIKPASLQIAFEGRVVYWDEKRKKVDKWISAKKSKNTERQFTLKRNSIAFVQVKPRFQLPYYIAIRFNLKITHVYRGLLLGTGPLVDPGYEGHLYIPLHNLTDNDYELLGGEGLLWMEFTKLQWDNDGRNLNSGDHADQKAECPEGFKTFPPRKIDLTLEDFFKKAYNNRAIPSSIPQEIRKARVSSQSAKRSVNRLRNIGLLALFGLGFAFYNMFKSTWELAYDVKQNMGDTVRQLQADRDAMKMQLESLSKKLNATTEKDDGTSLGN